MKKTFLITFALAGLLAVSCTTEEAAAPTLLKKELPITLPPTQEQIKQAESDTETEVYEQVVNARSVKPGVKFCKNDSFSNSSGSGYAEVTLKDGSVHYTYFTWLHDSLGKVHVAVLYEGTVPSKNSGC